MPNISSSVRGSFKLMGNRLSPSFWLDDARAQRREARVAWARRNARWLPLWLALLCFVTFGFVLGLGQ